MARLLSFSQYIGGADNVIVAEMTPSTQKQYTYNFDTNVSGYFFTADYRTLLVDQVTYDRTTGLPNFADSAILGYFGVTDTDITTIDTSSETAGLIALTIPAQRYTGTIMPDSRNLVPVTVVTFRWQNDSGVVDNHRYCILERWEPAVSPGEPNLDPNFIPMGVGAIKAITDNATANPTRATVTQTETIVNGNVVITSSPVTFNGVTGLTSGEGQGATFQAIVEIDGDVIFNILNRGTGYNANDTITILDSSVGGSGADNILITISSVG